MSEIEKGSIEIEVVLDEPTLRMLVIQYLMRTISNARKVIHIELTNDGDAVETDFKADCIVEVHGPIYNLECNNKPQDGE